MGETILIVEDDMEISVLITDTLFHAGYHLKLATNEENALQEVAHRMPDLLVFDLMIPSVNQNRLMEKIDREHLVPTIFIGSETKAKRKQTAYLAKPFSSEELLTLVRNLLNKTETKKIGELVINLEGERVEKNTVDLELTAIEFKLLLLFVRHPEQVFTKAEIYQKVWEQEYFDDENVINVHIRRLRAKIETVPSKPKYIKTIWGIGYKFGDI